MGNDWRRRKIASDPEYAARHAIEVKRANLKRRYGVTLEWYKAKLAEQGGVCAICHQLDSWGHWLAVDHDHQTGAPRALLCGPCNRGMGLLGDDPARLRAAAAYLETHRGG